MTCQPVRACVLACVIAATAPAIAAAQSHFSGSIGPGSSYEIDVPAVWNGDLVLYAHGIVQAAQPVLPQSGQDSYAAIRAQLLAMGYAVAASSYSSNGWSLGDAVRRTHQLSGIFVAKVGRPLRTLLVGHSMGALAIAKMAEQFAGQYDGALAMCGPLGGAVDEVAYAADARVTFDYYFPGVLPGSTFSVPDGTVFLPPGAPGGPSALFMQVFTAVSASPAKTLQWATAAKLPFANSAELGNSAFYMVGFLMNYTNDLVERVNGKVPYDNRLTQYQVNATADPAINAALSAQLNAGVTRYDGDRAALNYYERNYETTGRIGIPVVTVHTSRDPAIPVSHESVFAAKVAGAGRADWLAQRTIDRWGHCAITAAEAVDAFNALKGWVATGTKPW
jgi:pimeloyl-ACP methyl ester carboxylesterase